MSDRSGVEIDYCPNCRGIWLDKGELDKIIERSAEHYHGKGMQETPARDPHYNKEHDHYYHKDKYHYKKKKGFLGDLFDF
jgi:Zn-finger nucleic acid-binding protein